MKALFVDVGTRNVGRISLPDDEPTLFEQVRRLIGCRNLAVGATLDNADVLYVDEHGLFNSEEYFQHALVGVPLAGHGVVLGADDCGVPTDVRSPWGVTRLCVRFLDKYDVLEWSLEKQRDQIERVAA